MKKLYRARAPLRLGLAGGGTDVSPFSDIHGGYVINATIDLYAHAVLEPRADGIVSFSAEDMEEKAQFESMSVLPDQEPLRLHRGIYNRIVKDFNSGRPLSFNLTTFADAPAGSGLGTSSTIVVCIIQIMSEWLGLGMGEYDIAKYAYEIEREELGLSGGKQDQYAAAFGGFNFIEFGTQNRVLVNPLRVKDWVKNELEASTILYFTGRSRDSATIINEQVLSAASPSSQSLDAMFSLKKDAVGIKEAILRGDLQKYSEILGRSWEAKKRLATKISNPYLDSIYSGAISAGAISGKISGAGGGGFFMFYVPHERRKSVIRYLSQEDGEIIRFHFTQTGAQAWVSNP